MVGLSVEKVRARERVRFADRCVPLFCRGIPKSYSAAHCAGPLPGRSSRSAGPFDGRRCRGSVFGKDRHDGPHWPQRTCRPPLTERNNEPRANPTREASERRTRPQAFAGAGSIFHSNNAFPRLLTILTTFALCAQCLRETGYNCFDDPRSRTDG